MIGTIAANSEITVKIPRAGDLLSSIWIDLGTTGTLGGTAANGLPGLIGAEAENGGAIFEWYIGGQLVDRQDAFFMVQLWNKFLIDNGGIGGDRLTSAGYGEEQPVDDEENADAWAKNRRVEFVIKKEDAPEESPF